MKRKELLSIAEQFAAHDVRIDDEGKGFDIVNPYGKEPILVECEEEDPDPAYIVCFSFFHIHLETVEQVVAYVRDIVEGKRLVIGFFKDDRLCMSADLDEQEQRDLSYTGLSKRMHIGCYGKDLPYGDHRELIEVADSFRVRGWAQNTDFDAEFVLDAHGKVTIQKYDA